MDIITLLGQMEHRSSMGSKGRWRNIRGMRTTVKTSRGGPPMRRMALLILVFGLLLLHGRGEAAELTLLYSNDTRGVIDPCPT
jgi:hypothetical protein